MGALKNLIDALLTQPELSNQQIADRVGCDRRRVRRYRKLVRTFDLTAADVAGCDSDTLWRAFNHRPVRYTHAEPSFDALKDKLPTASAQAWWKIYAAQQAQAGRAALSYAQFVRRKQRWEGRA